MIDLHTHSTASDGTLPPSELLSEAEKADLRALALTDHDTVSGIDELLRGAATSPVETIPGVEIACRLEKRHIHLVGLFIDHEAPPLLDLLSRIREHRGKRNQRIIQKLHEQNKKIHLRDAEDFSSGEVIGRPHIARALVKHGYAENLPNAFDLFLTRGRSAFVPRWVPDAEEALSVLHQAGAVTIWAHPLTSGSLTGVKFSRAAADLQELGLDGLEVYYSEYTLNQQRVANRVAAELGLLCSGGSDFHGANFTGISLGKGYGRLRVPDDLLPPLKERAAGRDGGG